METKFNEVTLRTAVLEEMKDQYLAERLVRTWKEDFVDTDTGDVVQIERKEFICEKGTLIDHDTLSTINFYLQSGDIKDVLISNQSRSGHVTKNYPSVYAISVHYGKKKKTYYLYANSVELAITILTDFLEQKLEGVFSFASVKELTYSNLIPEQEEEDEEKDFYQIELELTKDDDESYNTTYILKAKDAEEAKETIEKFIILTREENNEKQQDFKTTILSAKTISCDSIVDYHFSKEYMENEKE